MNEVPVLGAEAWISDPAQSLSKLYEQAFVSDRSQSNLYHGEVISVQAIISDNPNDIETIRRELTTAFNKYLLRYFAEVDVQIADSSDDEYIQSRKIDIDIVATTDGGISTSLGSTISTRDISNIHMEIRRLNAKE